MDNLKKCCLVCKNNQFCKNTERKGQVTTFVCENFKWHSSYKSFNSKKKK